MLQPGLVIFDCDGVLVDSEPISIAVLLDVLSSWGVTIDEDVAYRRFLGLSMASITGIIRAEYGLEITPWHLDQVRTRLYDRFRRELTPIAGVAEAIDALDTRYCVASSSQPERIRLSLSVTGLLERLEPHIFSSTMVANGKPAPDLFLHAARAMGVAPSDCVVIEDSPAGIEAARRAGMRVLAFTGGSHVAASGLQATVEQMAPDAVFSDMRLLPGLLWAKTPKKRPTRDLICAVDVGTASARAGIFDRSGRQLGRGEHPIVINRPRSDFAEHDSADIWRAVCRAVQAARMKSNVTPEEIVGIGFDATCSLVVRDRDGNPLTVSPTGEPRWDTIVWLDHRAIAEADECTISGHRMLGHLGGVMSPEMQTPKLMWLKRNLPDTWRKSGHFFDLADFLTFMATGNTERSQCTLACKWAYVPHDRGWQTDFLDRMGLEDLIERGSLPLEATPVGTDLGPLTAQAAEALGLTTRCHVATGLIDAYAGAIGVLPGHDDRAIGRHAALIAGTSSCIMATSSEPRPIPGGWGPYFGAAMPDRWIVEGGQSATGALLDHLIRGHGAGGEPDRQMHARISERVMELRGSEGEDLAPRLHVLPDFHGNRSPLADPHAVGVISGLTLDSSFDALCRLYWRTAVGIALGVRHILDATGSAGYAIDTLHVTGGHVHNPLLMELYADATGCTVLETRAEDAVLLGTAMTAAAAASLYTDFNTACMAMRQPSTERRPNPQTAGRIRRDYSIFLEMHRQREMLDLLAGAQTGIE